jgi:hypothetical protein
MFISKKLSSMTSDETVFLITVVWSHKYKVVQIWPGQTVTCLHTISPGHIWTTLYFHCSTSFLLLSPKGTSLWRLGLQAKRSYMVATLGTCLTHLTLKVAADWKEQIKFVEYLLYVDWGLLFKFVFWCNSPTRARAASFLRFLDHAQRRIKINRTPLDEWSARRRDMFLPTYNIQKKSLHKWKGLAI